MTSEKADVTYKVSSYYERRPSAASPSTIPTIGIPWPVDEPLVSDRDRTNPRLAEIADELPW